MREGWARITAFAGGCQCGAVRFSVPEGPAKCTVCHCRMCQRATGNAFAPLIEVIAATATLDGPVSRFASSNIVERGFCAACGTPLFYRGLARDTIEFMVGAVDTPLDYRPSANHGVESRMDWLAGLAFLPCHETFLSEAETIKSFQAAR